MTYLRGPLAPRRHAAGTAKAGDAEHGRHAVAEPQRAALVGVGSGKPDSEASSVSFRANRSGQTASSVSFRANRETSGQFQGKQRERSGLLEKGRERERKT